MKKTFADVVVTNKKILEKESAIKKNRKDRKKKGKDLQENDQKRDRSHENRRISILRDQEILDEKHVKLEEELRDLEVLFAEGGGWVEDDVLNVATDDDVLAAKRLKDKSFWDGSLRCTVSRPSARQKLMKKAKDLDLDVIRG